MREKMEQADGFSHALACGHPGKKNGEQCELCGEKVAGLPEEAKAEQPEETKKDDSWDRNRTTKSSESF